MSELVLGNGVRVVDLVAENQERCLGKILHTEKSVELGFRFAEALGVFGVDQEDDAADFGEIILPQTARLLVTAQVECGKAAATDGELFGGWVKGWLEDGYAVVLEHVEELGP